ncbi:polyphosphate polymerase domain-containing protein [Kineococcus rubinsiae]|uniref:polyphosphate polymerase domain-containing protein n=1 Tax=Kineococcus rubinsiae TaxID=2609562 RepID=UPI00142F9A80|nr:polyphosphate polymerase domain-containing protein [Kineococcus rubinsiae]NIZ89728.1 polyphosphate polymerase domain-containing protein [Kineococcus rubinsiae]
MSPAPVRLRHLPAVGLDDLVREAELLVRVDRKYVVGIDEVDALLGQVPPGTRVLRIDGERDFGYRSTYFDTPDLRSYLTSGRSSRGRWKVRDRTYEDTGGTWLEVKTAGPRNQTVKRRLARPGPAQGAFCPEGTALLDGVVGPGTAGALRPVLVTTYRRSTLLLPGAAARVTVDVDLGWASLTSGRELTRPRLAIVETKTGSTPSPVDRLLWARGHRPVRISKFGAGMAALHPGLPRLKWHRALERHLSCPTRPTGGTTS